MGNTDSERAFCWLLQCLRQRFGDTLPAPGELFDALHGIACEIGSRGEFNFLLVERRPPDRARLDKAGLHRASNLRRRTEATKMSPMTPATSPPRTVLAVIATAADR